jgi:hypothetical protein
MPAGGFLSNIKYMSANLGLAIVLYIAIILYIHNNNKELLLEYSNSLPVLALASYYVSNLLLT